MRFNLPREIRVVDINETEAKRILREDRELAELFATFPRNEAWKRYQTLLDKMIQKRTGDLFEPILDGQQLAAEHNKGVIYGLILARDLPTATVNAMKQLANSDPASGDEE